MDYLAPIVGYAGGNPWWWDRGTLVMILPVVALLLAIGAVLIIALLVHEFDAHGHHPWSAWWRRHGSQH